ncbi:MAG: hypothetical protein EB164_06680 [Thaumarchaeota archaeon]|nr:hypothetical protein [Nitrososphaerota archaeon]
MNLEYIVIIAICILYEAFWYFVIRYVNKKFQWLIMSKDERPVLSEEGLRKFIPIGYDSELGWIRKPNTDGIEKSNDMESKWTINGIGARANPGFDDRQSTISCYGDSFTFCRQVNDDETWEHYLSELQDTNVKNFGVGNYGLDQTILRLKREYPKNKTEIVIIGVVPDTISRILSSWKHYYEYGNTFAFKPRFVIKNEKLVLIKNIIDEESKFRSYERFLPEIKKNDFFYKNKFRKEIIRFPYSIYLLRNLSRNLQIIFWVLANELMKGSKSKKNEWNPMKIIMRVNLRWRVKLYHNIEARTLFEKILDEYASYARQNNFMPVFCVLPQKDDVNFVRTNASFYKEFLHSLHIEKLKIIDTTDKLMLEKDLDSLYSDNNEYGGHYSSRGNKRIAEIINEELSRI